MLAYTLKWRENLYKWNNKLLVRDVNLNIEMKGKHIYETTQIISQIDYFPF